MTRAILLLVGSILMLAACTQRSICPAFQSAYIHDKDALRKKFSYFQEDSTPKLLTASKNKYLVAEPTPYRKKLHSLQTVEMKPVPVIVPDSIANGDSVSMEELDRAARSVIEETVIGDVPSQPQQVPVEDTVYVISKDKELRLLKYNGADSLVYDPVTEKYVAQKPEYYVKDVGLNIEQDNYMWYLRDYLVLPDVRLASIQQKAEKSREIKANKTKKKKEKKARKGFFKNLFKKKKHAPDSTEAPKPQQEEFDFIEADTISRANPPLEDTEKRKGLYASRNKKGSKAVTATPAVLPEAEKKFDSPPAQAVRKEETIEGF